jgi:hypothetical protein
MNHVAVFQINGVSVDGVILTPFLRSSILAPGIVLYQEKITVHVINRNWFREIHRFFYGNAELFYRQTGVAQ